MRHRLLYFVLLPAIAVAAAILAYQIWLSDSRFIPLGEETIEQSTLLLVREKVDVIEQYIIDADNVVFGHVDLADPESLKTNWQPTAALTSPSIRAVLVLDADKNPVSYAMRGSGTQKRRFLRIVRQRIVPDLDLEAQPVGRLKHLHRSYIGESYLISYKVLRYRGHRHYVIAYHDPSFIVKHEFPRLFATDEGKRHYNVVDEENRRVYGRSLAHAGDYLVGHRFPSTLYGWRLQVAPKQAPRLKAEARSRRLSQFGLIGTSLLVILLGVGFLLYAADKERRLNVLKSEFVANVSHELKTPLSVVRMFSELLLTKRVSSPAKQQEYLEIICLESERLSVLIENVLDFAALERGKRTYDMHPGDIKDVVTRAVDAFRYRAERDGTEIRLACPDEVPAVECDEQALILAVINLLDKRRKVRRWNPGRRDHRTERTRGRDSRPGSRPRHSYLRFAAGI